MAPTHWVCHLAPCVYDLSLLNQNTTQYRVRTQLHRHHFASRNNVHRPERLTCMQATKCQRHTSSNCALIFSIQPLMHFVLTVYDKPDWFVGLFVCLLKKKHCVCSGRPGVCMGMRERVFVQSDDFTTISFDLFVYLFVLLHRVSIIHNSVRKSAIHTYCSEWMK